MQAAAGSHVEVVKTLLQAKVDVNAQARDGMTALLVAVEACASNHGDLDIEEPYWEVMRLLAKAGADVNSKNEDGQSALVIAKSYEDQRAAKVLTELGAK